MKYKNRLGSQGCDVDENVRAGGARVALSNIQAVVVHEAGRNTRKPAVESKKIHRGEHTFHSVLASYCIGL